MQEYWQKYTDMTRNVRIFFKDHQYMKGVKTAKILLYDSEYNKLLQYSGLLGDTFQLFKEQRQNRLRWSFMWDVKRKRSQNTRETIAYCLPTI